MIRLCFPILDSVVLLAFLLFLSFSHLQQLLQDNSSQKYLFQTMKWTDARQEDESTYYHRTCRHGNTSTQRVSDLLVAANTSARDTLLTHGVALLPQLFDNRDRNQTIESELREWILQQNLIQPQISVIENNHRWSFAIQLPNDPNHILHTALNNLLSNRQLVQSLEEVVGPNPALIEFTAITSAYGATEQRWHYDVLAEASATKYARSFVPSYSLFIPLQNTTTAMGATHICPGTHLCSDNDDGLDQLCRAQGMPVSSSKGGWWPAGYGALVNQQTHHKGAAHTDPHAPERVLFILTWAPRPYYDQVETKYIAHGGSYSLHWSQWGFTLRDLQHSTHWALQWPWRSFRALGIWYFDPSGSYKPEWGWDFVTQASARIVNADGYTPEELESFFENGGFTFLPSFLRVPVSEIDRTDAMAGFTYAQKTIDRCYEVARRFFFASLVLFLLVSLLRFFFVRQRTGRVVGGSAVRLFAGICMVYFCFRWFTDRSFTSWTKHVQHERMFQLGKKSRLPTLKSTLPNDHDILVTTDYQGREMASFEDLLDHAHPGNRKWKKWTLAFSLNYQNLGRLQYRLCSLLVREAYRDSSRFLHQDDARRWAKMEDDEAEYYCHSSLYRSSNKVAGAVLHELDRLWSNVKFGQFRDMALHVKWVPLLLQTLEKRLTKFDKKALPSGNEFMMGGSSKIETSRRGLFLVKTLPTVSQYSTLEFPKRSSFPGVVPVNEPFDGAWLQDGDEVEALFSGGANQWYHGTISDASSGWGTYSVEYTDDGEIDARLCRSCVRRFKGHKMGTEVEWNDGRFNFHPGVIIAVHDDGTYDVRLEENGGSRKNVEVGRLRRSLAQQRVALPVGSRIRARFEGGDEWFPGVIETVNQDDGTYDVAFDDGDFGERIAFQDIASLI